jgi:hypothetical protein
MAENKAQWGKFIYGLIGGAILVLIVGFAIGPLTTNGSAASMASEAAAERDIVYCVANAQRLVDLGDATAPSSSAERTDLARASFADLLPDETFSSTVLRNCTRAFPQEF